MLEVMLWIVVFGEFVARIRKKRGMTQADLAEKIHVTDKAVSRWERGVGFPDINSLEPLAEALEIGVYELIKSKEGERSSYESSEAVELMRSALEMDKAYRRQERTLSLLIVFTAVLTAALFRLTGRVNLGGAVFMGLLAGGAEAGLYLYGENREDKTGKRIYGAASLLFGAIVLAYICRLLLT